MSFKVTEEEHSAACINCSATNFREPITEIFGLNTSGRGGAWTLNYCRRCLVELGKVITQRFP